MTTDINDVYGYLTTDKGILEIRANAHGIASIYFVDKKRHPETSHQYIEKAKAQLTDYFRGKLETFDLPISMHGTEFQRDVWQALCTIPFGETCSYADIANKIGRPKAVRAVGAANGKNPISIVVPCHRVIGTNGTLTGYAGGLERKAWLLALEQKQGELL